MKFLLPGVFLFFILQACSSADSLSRNAGGLELHFYDSTAAKKFVLSDLDIDSVRWTSKHQRYFIAPFLQEKLNSENMQGGKIRIFFKNQLLDELSIRTFKDIQPPGHEVLCTVQGKLIFSKNALALPSVQNIFPMPDSILLLQEELYQYLKENRKLSLKENE